jgi:serine/threonine-protein kinase
LAQVLQKSSETSNMIAGTPMYMAPEQILEPEAVDARADIYASATMLYEMLSPEPLFAEIGSIQEILQRKTEQRNGLFVKKISEMNSNLNEEIDRILSKALSFDPESRYATCCDFRLELERYSEQYLRN